MLVSRNSILIFSLEILIFDIDKPYVITIILFPRKLSEPVSISTVTVLTVFDLPHYTTTFLQPLAASLDSTQ